MRSLGMRSNSFFLILLWIGGVAVLGVRAGPVTFLNDYEGFLAAAGDVRTIDFDTLPDGSPSPGDRYITPDFNYTDQGVTFSVPVGRLFIGGNSVSGFTLLADAYNEQQRTWIIADLAPAASAVGVFYAGFMELRAYDSSSDLIGSAAYSGIGIKPPPYFIGIVSDEPIGRVIADSHNGVDFVTIVNDFAYAPIPEPTSVFLVLVSAVALARGRSRK